MADPNDSVNPFGRMSLTSAPQPRKSKTRQSKSILPNKKTAWRRVSTRNWIRNFRTFAAKFYNIPLKTYCKMFFLTSGYYPTMVNQPSYLAYLRKFPVTTKGRQSVGSGIEFAYPGQSGTDMSTLVSTTEVSTSSVYTESDDNANQKKYVPPPWVFHTKKSLAMEEKRRASVGKDIHPPIMVPKNQNPRRSDTDTTGVSTSASTTTLTTATEVPLVPPPPMEPKKKKSKTPAPEPAPPAAPEPKKGKKSKAAAAAARVSQTVPPTDTWLAPGGTVETRRSLRTEQAAAVAAAPAVEVKDKKGKKSKAAPAESSTATESAAEGGKKGKKK